MTTSLDQRGVFTDRSITIDVEKVQQTTYITENIGRQLVDDNCGIAMLMSNLESLITHALQVPNSICLDRPSIRKAVAAQHALRKEVNTCHATWMGYAQTRTSFLVSPAIRSQVFPVDSIAFLWLERDSHHRTLLLHFASILFTLQEFAPFSIGSIRHPYPWKFSSTTCAICIDLEKYPHISRIVFISGGGELGLKEDMSFNEDI
ncbi:MAG: hypothetical protein CL912_01230 [Deltaproteobacteria bacterium]|nr:hypothetical protein [Deltaproteobacteria bacterium]|tara:strand:+ start:1773 stop:2387 length:615 start_codon:yes stop_codon:yes gene_type:complete